MNTSKIYFLLLAASLVLVSCKKNNPPALTQTGVNEAVQPTLDLGASMTTGYFGRVTNSAGVGLWGATVYCGTNSAVTDANGVFKIEMTTGKEKQAFVTVSKDGYHTTGRSFVPVANAYNYVEVTLVEKNLVDFYTTGDPEVVTLQAGYEIEFSGGYVDEVGNDYVGSVNAYFDKFSAVDPLGENTKVGGTFGQDANGTAKYFETFGGMMIHLEGVQGQTLEIAQGSSAEIRLRIDGSQVADAPDEVALAYFNTATGYWVQDGIGTLVGDQYIGEISHLGTWSFAHLRDLATIEGATVNASNDTLYNFPVQVITENGRKVFHSSSTGVYKANVPASYAVDMQTIDRCGDGNSVVVGGPFPAGATSQFDFQIPGGLVTLNRQFGTLLGCAAQPLANGYVLVQIGNEFYPQLVKNGVFNVDNINCTGASLFSVSGVNLNSGEGSIVKEKTLLSPLSSAGDVFACANYNEYLSLSIDAAPATEYYSNLYCAQLDTGGGWFFKIYPDDYAVQIYGNTFTPGSYTYSAPGQINTVRVNPSQMAPFQSFNINIELLAYGDVGDYVSLTFTGFFTDALLATHTVEGDLVVVRDF